MKGYEAMGYWKTMNMNWCFMCGKPLLVVQHTLFPACDYYDAGGFCTIPFGDCIFEHCSLCEECAKEPVVYVGDMCADIGGPMAREEEDYFGEDEYYWEDPMDDAYYPAI